jgi:ribosomal protein S18 acetylase RimI-like enzyme
MMDFAVKRASAEDSAAIAALHASSWRTTYRGILRDQFLDSDVEQERRAVWSQRLRDPADDQLVLVACTHDELAGFICVKAKDDPEHGALIDNLHVAKTEQARGVGTTLMHEAARWVNARDASEGVYLWVMEANAVARRFYERLGAQNHERVEKQNPGGGVAPNLRYRWPKADVLIEACATRTARYGQAFMRDEA